MSISARHLTWMLLSVVASFLAADPSGATSCNQKEIADTSTEQAADWIFGNSDLIGFGYISTVHTPERVQQSVDLLVAIKGEAGRRYDFAPLRIGRTGWKGPGLYKRNVRPDEIVLVALVGTEQGYVTPACQDLLVATKGPELVRRLAAIGSER